MANVCKSIQLHNSHADKHTTTKPRKHLHFPHLDLVCCVGNRPFSTLLAYGSGGGGRYITTFPKMVFRPCWFVDWHEPHEKCPHTHVSSWQGHVFFFGARSFRQWRRCWTFPFWTWHLPERAGREKCKFVRGLSSLLYWLLIPTRGKVGGSALWSTLS